MRLVCLVGLQMAHAMLYAVANAARTDPDNMDLLNNSKRFLLNARFKFQLATTVRDCRRRTLKLMGVAPNIQSAWRRSCFKQCQEIEMVRDALLESMSSSELTPALLCKRYYERMPSVARTVTP